VSGCVVSAYVGHERAGKWGNSQPETGRAAAACDGFLAWQSFNYRDSRTEASRIDFYIK
jgi:hypothetical protein